MGLGFLGKVKPEGIQGALLVHPLITKIAIALAIGLITWFL